MKVWTDVLSEMGALESFSDGEVVPLKGHPKGDAAKTGIVSRTVSTIMGWGVYVNQLNFEAGELTGRLSFNRDDQIDGVLILPVGTTEFAF